MIPEARHVDLAPRLTVARVSETTDSGHGIDVGGLSPQGRSGAEFTRSSGERVEVVVPDCVLVRDLVDRRLIEVGEELLEVLGRVRPRRVGVGVVTLPTHVVDVELVEETNPDAVFDEAAQDAILAASSKTASGFVSSTSSTSTTCVGRATTPTPTRRGRTRPSTSRRSSPTWIRRRSTRSRTRTQSGTTTSTRSPLDRVTCTASALRAEATDVDTVTRVGRLADASDREAGGEITRVPPRGSRSQPPETGLRASVPDPGPP